MIRKNPDGSITVGIIPAPKQEPEKPTPKKSGKTVKK